MYKAQAHPKVRKELESTSPQVLPLQKTLQKQGIKLPRAYQWAIPPVRLGLFRKKFRKNSGRTPETLSERFLEFPSRVRLGCPKPYNSRHSRLPERFQNSLLPSTAGDASFFRSGSGEGLSELVMEFPAALGVFLNQLASSTSSQRLLCRCDAESQTMAIASCPLRMAHILLSCVP